MTFFYITFKGSSAGTYMVILVLITFKGSSAGAYVVINSTYYGLLHKEHALCFYFQTFMIIVKMFSPELVKNLQPVIEDENTVPELLNEINEEELL